MSFFANLIIDFLLIFILAFAYQDYKKNYKENIKGFIVGASAVAVSLGLFISYFLEAHIINSGSFTLFSLVAIPLLCTGLFLLTLQIGPRIDIKRSHAVLAFCFSFFLVLSRIYFSNPTFL